MNLYYEEHWSKLFVCNNKLLKPNIRLGCLFEYQWLNTSVVIIIIWLKNEFDQTLVTPMGTPLCSLKICRHKEFHLAKWVQYISNWHCILCLLWSLCCQYVHNAPTLAVIHGIIQEPLNCFQNPFYCQVLWVSCIPLH